MSEPFWIFVVDDDEAVRASICFLLGCHGYMARGFASAAEFLREAAGEAGVLVVELELREQDGEALLAALRADGGRNRPAIVMATHVAKAQKLVARGLAGWAVEKPFLPEALLACVREAAGRGQAGLVS